MNKNNSSSEPSAEELAALKTWWTKEFGTRTDGPTYVQRDCFVAGLRAATIAPASQPVQGVGLTEIVEAIFKESGYTMSPERIRAILARQPAPTVAAGCPDLSDDTLPHDLMRRNIQAQVARRASGACQHDFKLDFASSIEFCAKCGSAKRKADAAPTLDSAPQGDEHATVKRIRELCDGLTINQLKATLDGWIAAAPQQPAAERAAVPEGWKLVPVEPTDEMIEAGDECWQMTSGNAAGYYRAMLAAAPSPAPVAQEGENDGASTQYPHLYVGNRVTGPERGYVLPAAQQTSAQVDAEGGEA